MIKNFLGVIAGIVTGWLVFTGAQMLSHAVSPKPAGLDINDLVSIKELLDNMPLYAWLIVILGYILGSFAAGFVTGKIVESNTSVLPVIAAVFFMLGWLGNIMWLPHPMWIVILVFLVFVPMTLLGHKFATGGTKA